MTAIVATSHVDLHGDMIAPGALESMAEVFNTHYLQMMWQHDPRVPPLGRWVSGRIVELEDGAVGVEATAEMFEPGDDLGDVVGEREIVLHTHDQGSAGIGFDQSYADSESQVLIREIGELLGGEPRQEVKKALEPLSALVIFGGFAAGAAAVGFFNKLGADGYDALRNKLKAVFSRASTRSPKQERLLIFELTLQHGDASANSEIILTNPTDADIDAVLDKGLAVFDRVAPNVFDEAAQLRRIVYEYIDGKLVLRYAVRKDGVPLYASSEGSDEGDA